MSKKEITEIVEGAARIAQRMIVYDDELQKNVEVTAEMQEEAWQEYTNLQQSVISVAVCLSRIREKKHYLAYGFNNFADFYKSLGYHPRKAQRLANIGEMVDGKTTHVSLLEGIDQLKLVELTRLSKEMQDVLFAGGEIIAPNGQPLNLKSIRKMPREEFIQALSEKSKENLSKLKADKQLQREEIAALKTKVKKQEATIEGLENLKWKYEPVENNSRSKKEALRRAGEYLDSFVKQMNLITLEEHDSQDVLDRFAQITGTFERIFDDNLAAWRVALMEIRGE